MEHTVTEKLLSDWTGLSGKQLTMFYLMYKQHASNTMSSSNLEHLKQDIIKFQKTILKETDTKNANVTSLIAFWESQRG